MKHFSDMAQGLVPYQRKFYKVHPQVGSGDIKIVTPTEAVVERAKMAVKRKLKEASAYKPKRFKAMPQSGAGGRKRRVKKKKSSGKNKQRRKKSSTKKAGKQKKKKTKRKSKSKP